MQEVKIVTATLLLVQALPPPPSPLLSPPPPLSLTLPPRHLPSSRGELILDLKICKEAFENNQMVLSYEDNCLIFATFDLSQNRLFVVLQHNGR